MHKQQHQQENVFLNKQKIFCYKRYNKYMYFLKVHLSGLIFLKIEKQLQ